MPAHQLSRLEEILEDLALSHYFETFLNQGLTDDVLSTLEDSDLKELGIEKMGDRKRILQAIAPLTSNQLTFQSDYKQQILLNAVVLAAILFIPWFAENGGTLMDVHVEEGSKQYLLKYIAIGGACVSLYFLTIKNTPNRLASLLVFLALFVLIFWLPIRMLFESPRPPGWFDQSLKMAFEIHGIGAWTALLAALAGFGLAGNGTGQAKRRFYTKFRDWLDRETGLPRWKTSRRITHTVLCLGAFAMPALLLLKERPTSEMGKPLLYCGLFACVVLILSWLGPPEQDEATQPPFLHDLSPQMQKGMRGLRWCILACLVLWLSVITMEIIWYLGILETELDGTKQGFFIQFTILLSALVSMTWAFRWVAVPPNTQGARGVLICCAVLMLIPTLRLISSLVWGVDILDPINDLYPDVLLISTVFNPTAILVLTAAYFTSMRLGRLPWVAVWTVLWLPILVQNTLFSVLSRWEITVTFARYSLLSWAFSLGVLYLIERRTRHIEPHPSWGLKASET